VRKSALGQPAPVRPPHSSARFLVTSFVRRPAAIELRIAAWMQSWMDQLAMPIANMANNR
jgi:hypothetical protein